MGKDLFAVGLADDQCTGFYRGNHDRWRKYDHGIHAKHNASRSSAFGQGLLGARKAF